MGYRIERGTIVTAFVWCGIMISPQYQLKEFDKLTSEETRLAVDITNKFYSEEPDRTIKLDSIEHKAFPELKKLKEIGDKLPTLILPSKKRSEAKYRSQIIYLQCHFFKLLYLEFKSQNSSKYRPEIESTTDKINDIRREWGKDACY